MGAAHSSAMATVDSAISASVSIALANTQSCNISANSVFSGTQICTNCKVCIQEIKDVDFNAEHYVNQSCVADFNVTVDARQQIKQKFDQAAEALNKGLNIGANSTDAKTITRMMADLSTKVAVVMKQSVNAVTSDLLALNQYASNCDLASQTMHDISFKSYSKHVQTSAMKSVQSLKIYHDLSTAVKQVSKATNAGLDMNFLVVIIAALVALAIVFGFGGREVVKDFITTKTGMVITLVIIGVVVALSVAKIANIWPFGAEDRRISNSVNLPCTSSHDCASTLVCANNKCGPQK